jgi:hypothetical protein
MEPVIYETTCFEVWTDMGTEYVPLHYICEDTGLKHTELGIMHREGELKPHLAPYLDAAQDFIYQIDIVHGWYAYMTMPGYLDRTEGTLHESEELAEEYLAEVYGCELESTD